MACPEAAINQETKYLNALQAAERFEWKDPYLLLHCKGFEKPLRLTREGPPTPAAREGEIKIAGFTNTLSTSAFAFTFSDWSKR